MRRSAAWVLSNFCWGEPQPPFEQTKPVLPVLERLIHSTDEEVLADVCWTLSSLSHGGTDDKIQAVIEANVCSRLVELLMHPSPSVIIPALRIVGNIEKIKKGACWTISNITAGNKDQIQAVVAAEIIGPLIHMPQTAEFDIKKEAARAISNVTSGGTDEQIKYLVGQGCIRPLCDLLVCPDPRIVMTVCLEGLENILMVGEAEKNLGTTSGVNVYAQLIDEAEGLEKIKNLQMKILETYWMEDDDEPLPPSDAAAGSSEQRELVSHLKRPTPENPSENTNGMETQAEGDRAQLEQPETGVFRFPIWKKLKTWLHL
ncbi:hypothetical protein MKW92_017857 [Papaver armeniacum]|nr:hypothetical protein MKW92_017857 [Papaver armeniacum]